MLRALSHATSVRKLFYRRHPTDFRIAKFTRSPINFKYKDPREREPCPIPDPPPPPPAKDRKLFWGTIAFMALTGGFVVYAKKNPEIRDWLSINASWFDDFIAVAYQENMTYGEFASLCINSAKVYIENLRGVNKPKKCSIHGGPVKDVPEDPKDKGKPEEKKEDVKVAVKEPPPAIKQSICDIEKCIIEMGECALNNYYTAKEACASYNRLVEDTMASFTYRRMKALKHAVEERIELVEKSLNNASDCINKLDEWARYVDCGSQASKDQKKNFKLIHQDFHQKLKASFMEYQWENDRSSVMDNQWQMVEALVDKYTRENESLFNNLKYSAKRPHLSGDLDVLFTNTLRYITALEAQLKDASAAMTERINRSVDGLPPSDTGPNNRSTLLSNAIKDKKAALDKDYKRREEDQKQKNERFLKESLKKLQDKHDEKLSGKLLTIETEVKDKFDQMVAEKVAAEKKIFTLTLQEMAMKLQDVEASLKERFETERETRRSQELWAAGASLLAATKKGEPYVRVDKELKAIEKASSEDDKLVLTVLKSIPKSVREKGIVPESVLRASFRIMEKTARSVALIEQEGAPMPVYMLSWLQGLLLFMKMSGIPQREFEKPPLKPAANLDTFDLLQRARFWVDRGNLAVALRYVDSLKGASRAAAAKWFEQARAHIEVKQAAEAILAHAAAMGLRYI